MIALTTGENMEKPASALAARVTDSARRFNLREGLQATDDWLPKRLLNEALPDGRQMASEDLRQLVDDYYRLRGWRETGQLQDANAVKRR
jgi:aldehyde:ferredoxin oxidoreductase